MNKKLVAVAVAGVLAAPLAAQAQTANVTLYGRLNVDYELLTGKQADGTNPNVSRLSSNSSRIGVRGTESLGGGLNAIFQIESNVSGDTGNSSGSGLASRETFVGFQGTWGTFKMGKFLMPYDDLHPIFGNVPTYTTSILSTADLWAQGTLSKFGGGFDARLGNSVRYDSPVYSGFNYSAQISMRDSSGFADNGLTSAPSATAPTVFGGDNGDHTSELRHAYVWGIAGYYNNGPIQGGIGYERNVKVRAPTLDDYAFTVTGGYNFGIVRPALVYEKLDYDTPTGSLKRDLWGVSLTAPLGPGAAYFLWGQAGDGKGSPVAGTSVGGMTTGSQTSSISGIERPYPPSKRTQVWAVTRSRRTRTGRRTTFNINAYTITRRAY
jgi:predicted porin